MGKLFLASRSTLGTTVLCMPVVGAAFPLKSESVDVDNNRMPLEWGPGAHTCLPLADALLCAALDLEGLERVSQLLPLAGRLAQCKEDTWIMTEAEVLADFPLTP